MNFYSQYGEDRWIVENLNPRPGYFCEVGAFDGTTGSNTLHFEENGWSGILVEPDPEMARRSKRISPIICCAIGSGASQIRPFYVNDEDRGLSGFERAGRAIIVPVLRLDAIVSQPLALLSIDTEGTELEVWATRGAHHPKIVIMEYNTAGKPLADEIILDQMHRDGYIAVHRTECNLIFVPK